jgi:hypothetical protein
VGGSFGTALISQAREEKQNTLYLAVSTLRLVITEDFLSNISIRSDWANNYSEIPPVDLQFTTTRNFSVDKKNQLDVTFCILYFFSNSFSTCFGQPCAHHQELTTA